MAGACPVATGARIGGARAAGSGAAIHFAAVLGAGRGGALEGTELWPLRAVHISAGELATPPFCYSGRRGYPPGRCGPAED